uniref:Uncharacterized protein n=1 Tax=Rhizophora mucronata TaxID=61149 RepID=A0A2P2MDI2_RHIMU
MLTIQLFKENLVLIFYLTLFAVVQFLVLTCILLSMLFCDSLKFAIN